MDEDIADFSQKISLKNSEKPSMEQDNLTQSAIPMSSGTNNSHVGEFEDILGQMKEKPKENNKSKTNSKSKSDNSFKKKRQIPKNKTSSEMNEEKEEDENEEEESEENEIENDNEEEEEEEEQEQEQEESNSRINIDKEKEKNEKERQRQINNKNSKIKKEISLSNFDIINQDEKLKPFELNIKQRILHYKKTLNEIIKLDKSLENFAKSYENMGITLLPSGDIKYREYAPGAKGVSLFGEFNNWNKEQYWAIKDKFGFWELIIPNQNGVPVIQHGQIVKVNVVLEDGNWMERNPIWSHYLIQNKESMILDNIFWNSEIKYNWSYNKKHMKKPTSLKNNW